jgi:hypothetical protein
MPLALGTIVSGKKRAEYGDYLPLAYLGYDVSYSVSNLSGYRTISRG